MKCLRFALLFGWLFAGFAAPVLAGDCGSPDDCKALPDNYKYGSVLVRLLAGGGLLARSLSNADDSGGEDRPDDEANNGQESEPAQDSKPEVAGSPKAPPISDRPPGE